MHQSGGITILAADALYIIASFMCVLSCKKKSPAAVGSQGENWDREWDGRVSLGCGTPHDSLCTDQTGGKASVIEAGL